MNYGTEQPLTASTPRAITTPAGEIQPTDTYRQIIPGMSERLYPTLTADSSLSTPASDDCSTLHKQITTELDKYLQKAAEKREVEDNYFDGRHMLTNTSTSQQEANYLEKMTMPLTLKKPPIQQNQSLMSKTLAYIMIVLPITRPNPRMS